MRPVKSGDPAAPRLAIDPERLASLDALPEVTDRAMAITYTAFGAAHGDPTGAACILVAALASLLERAEQPVAAFDAAIAGCRAWRDEVIAEQLTELAATPLLDSVLTSARDPRHPRKP